MGPLMQPILMRLYREFWWLHQALSPFSHLPEHLLTECSSSKWRQVYAEDSTEYEQ